MYILVNIYVYVWGGGGLMSKGDLKGWITHTHIKIYILIYIY